MYLPYLFENKFNGDVVYTETLLNSAGKACAVSRDHKDTPVMGAGLFKCEFMVGTDVLCIIYSSI